MIRAVKHWLLRTLEHAGYVVLKVPHHRELVSRAGALPSLDDRDHQIDADDYHARCGLQDMDADFLPHFEACRPFTMTSAARMFALYQSIRYLEQARIPGDVVECGVWRGGSMMLAGRTLLNCGSTARQLWLYDTFAGLPRPDAEKDVDVFGNRMIDSWKPREVSAESSTMAHAGLDEVRRNLLSTGYPESQLRFVKGMVEQTIPQQMPAQIALLRLDTDWYESIRHSLIHLFPRLAPNGVLILDDYGHLHGARQAVDEYFAEQQLPILLHRVDYSGRVAVKTPPGGREESP